VESHGGKLIAQSEGLGKGATFTVELPVTSQRLRVASIDQSRSDFSDHEAESEPSMRLLVVEDDQATLQVLARLLRRAGHQITAVTNITAARDAAAHHVFDAVISDVGLPDGTGGELMEHLHAAYGLRGIALSGYGMEEDLQRSSRAGFTAHLVKPVDVNELRRALRRLAQDRR